MRNRINLLFFLMVISGLTSGCSPWQPTEQPAAQTSMSLPAEAQASPALPDWLAYGGHLYTLTEPMTWMDAEALAAAWGGHLIAINDRAEEEWLRSQFELREYWIGLSDLGEEGTWVWASGEPVSYTNWCAGEPNNNAGEGRAENVAVLNWKSGGDCWNDVPLEGLIRGIVEK